MNINKFTQNSLQAVQNCEKIAADNGNRELAQEHLLYALLTQDDSLILKLLDEYPESAFRKPCRAGDWKKNESPGRQGLCRSGSE